MPPGQLSLPQDPIRIVIADDDPVFVEMLQASLSEQEIFDVVGTAATGAEAIVRVEELRPDLVLMDLAMPVLDGVNAMREIRKLPDSPAVVFLTSDEDEVRAHEAYRTGADAYLRKAKDLPLLIGVIVAVSQARDARQ